jgi:hypothetical protein
VGRFIQLRRGYCRRSSWSIMTEEANGEQLKKFVLGDAVKIVSSMAKNCICTCMLLLLMTVSNNVINLFTKYNCY